MDDLNALERQIEGQLNGFVGPVLPVDDAAIFAAVTTTQSPKWRFPSMFSATKFVVAGAIVALFGGFLLSGILTEQRPEAPAAEAAGRGVAVSGVMAVPVASPVPTDVFEGEGFGAASYVLDGWPVDFDDDRLDGILSGRVEMAFYEPEVAVIGGHMEIVNDEGAWSGVIRGAGVSDDDWRILIMLDGSGAYAGLAATMVPNGDGSDLGRLDGVIYAPDDLDPSQRPDAATE